MDWTTSKSNHSNQQMPCESSSLNLISGSAMIVGLKITHITLEHYTTRILSNVFSSIWHISHCRRTSILNWCASQTWKPAEYTARWTLVIGGGICVISFLPERQLFQSCVHPTKLTWPIFQGISIPGQSISQMVIFEKISAGHLRPVPGFLLGWSHVPRKVPPILTKHGIASLEMCYLNSGILT